jgi:hypothetical protein
MTTTAHKLATIANNHGIVGLGPYTTAALRRAAVLTSADVGKIAQQTDTDPATYWIVLRVVSGVGTWSRVDTGAETIGPTGTDFAALAVSNGLGVVGYFRADSGLSGSSGSGLASWAPLSGAMSAITPHASATNGIGAATAGLGGRAGLKLNGATQMGQYTAPTLAVPGTTNWHRYWVARQASSGVSGAAREILTESGNAYMVQFASSTQVYAYGCQSNGNLATNDVWQRYRTSCTGANTGQIKIGSQAAGTGGTGATNTAPNTARVFGNLVLNHEFLMYMEVTGPLANFGRRGHCCSIDLDKRH